MYQPTLTLKLSVCVVGMCLFSPTSTWAEMLLVDDFSCGAGSVQTSFLNPVSFTRSDCSGRTVFHDVFPVLAPGIPGGTATSTVDTSGSGSYNMGILNGTAGDLAIFEVTTVFTTPVNILDMSIVKLEIANLAASAGNPTVTFTATLQGGNDTLTGEPVLYDQSAGAGLAILLQFDADEIAAIFNGEVDELTTTVSLPVNSDISLTINSIAFVCELPGDFDIDGDVDGFDFLKWQRGESFTPNSAADLVDWEANYGTIAPFSAASTAVPEPSTWIVLLIGMATLLTGGRTVVSEPIR